MVSFLFQILTFVSPQREKSATPTPITEADSTLVSKNFDPIQLV